MLERYFVKPQTVDRIRASWIGPEIEQYVDVVGRARVCAAVGAASRAGADRFRGVRVGWRRAARLRSCPVMSRGSWLSG